MSLFKHRIKRHALNMIEEFGDKPATQLYKFLMKRDISKAAAKHMLQHYQECVSEVDDAIKKSDPQAVEAYRLLSKKQLDSLHLLYYSNGETVKRYIKEKEEYWKFERKRKKAKKRINTMDNTKDT